MSPWASHPRGSVIPKGSPRTEGSPGSHHLPWVPVEMPSLLDLIPNGFTWLYHPQRVSMDLTSPMDPSSPVDPWTCRPGGSPWPCCPHWFPMVPSSPLSLRGFVIPKISPCSGFPRTASWRDLHGPSILKVSPCSCHPQRYPWSCLKRSPWPCPRADPWTHHPQKNPHSRDTHQSVPMALSPH